MGKQLFGLGWIIPPKQQKKDTDAFYKKVYPLGDKQKEWEDEIINELFDKKRIQPIKYVCLIRKEMLADDEYDEEEYLQNLKNMFITGDERKFIEYITSVELDAKLLEELPDLETVKKSYYL